MCLNPAPGPNRCRVFRKCPPDRPGRVDLTTRRMKRSVKRARRNRHRTGSHVPVTKSEAFEARNTAIPARSSGLPPSPGRGARQHLLVQSRHLRPRPLSVSSVSIQPGSTAFTWMPSFAHAVASARVSCTTPPLLAAYGRRVRRAEDRHHRADVDDLSPAPAPHLREGRLAAQERAGEVGVHHMMPLRLVILLGLLSHRRARVVDQDVEPARTARPSRAPGRGSPPFAVTSAATEGASEFAPPPAPPWPGRVRTAPAWAPAAGQSARHAKPDAAIAPGDKGDLAGEIEQVHARAFPIALTGIIRHPLTRTQSERRSALWSEKVEGAVIGGLLVVAVVALAPRCSGIRAQVGRCGPLAAREAALDAARVQAKLSRATAPSSSP